MNRIAIISDIHGNMPALEAVVANFKNRDIDTVINLGDHISGPLWPKETIEFLMQRDWIHIMGNHDRQLTHQNPVDHGLSDKHAFQFLNEEEIYWLKSLPSEFQLKDNILAFHGSPGMDSLYLLETIENGRTRLSPLVEIDAKLNGINFPIMLCGHTHIPRVVSVSKKIAIINPGSVGLQAYEDDSDEYHIVETGSPFARYSILEYADQSYNVENIIVPYNYELAVTQARKNNRPDWEIALETGFMRSQDIPNC